MSTSPSPVSTSTRSAGRASASPKPSDTAPPMAPHNGKVRVAIARRGGVPRRGAQPGDHQQVVVPGEQRGDQGAALQRVVLGAVERAVSGGGGRRRRAHRDTAGVKLLAPMTC